VRVPDLNLLIYAVDRESALHRSALRWWNGTLSGTETVGLAWAVLLGFVRLTTKSRVVRTPLQAGEAGDYLGRWLGHGADQDKAARTLATCLLLYAPTSNIPPA
jgi:predicted nucleic acid-binding protein